MYKVGLSSCGRVLSEALFAEYKESGIDFMEISVKAEENKALDFQQLKTWADKYGVSLWSYHLPFSPFTEINISDRTLCKTTLEHFSALMQKAGKVGIRKFILHASGEPIKDEERLDKMDCAKENLYKLAEIAKEVGGVICVENLPRSCLGKNSEEIKELISVHPDLRVCYDTNHLLAENSVAFIKAVGNKIVSTHVSDYDFVNERHWLPGEGKLNFSAILTALKEVGYSGIWLYEISPTCPKTIDRNRELTCADFVKNARELFLGKKPTVFSTPKPNLGMWE